MSRSKAGALTIVPKPGSVPACSSSINGPGWAITRSAARKCSRNSATTFLRSISMAKVHAFEDEMRQAKVDWQLVSYGGAVHSFTDSGAGTDNSKGAAYNEKADHRSWAAMQVFFQEIFK